MIAVLRNPVHRITLAITFSVLIHAAILWPPYIQLPQPRLQLPPLSVRLEPLPKPVESLAKPEPAKQEPGYVLARTVDGDSAKPANKAMAAMKSAEETTSIQPFPKRLQLTFSIYKESNSLRTGEIHQQFDIHEGRYTLKSVRQSAGFSRLRNRDRLIETSLGKLGEHGLQPDIFEQKLITGNGTQNLQATFNWKEQKLDFLLGNETALPPDAQDILSFLYQLSQISMDGEYFALPVSDGEQLQQYQIEIGLKEEITTPMGKLRALHLRKIHTDGEAYFEIWLGLEYRLLPVKFSRVDSSGKVIEEYDISAIRVANE